MMMFISIVEPGATGGYSPTNDGQDSDNSSLDDDDDIDSDDERFKSDPLEEVRKVLVMGKEGVGIKYLCFYGKLRLIISIYLGMKACLIHSCALLN